MKIISPCGRYWRVQPCYGFKAGTLEAISNFVTMIKMFQSELQKKNAYDLAVIVGKSTLIVKELFNDKTTEGVSQV